ncbi:FKBP-type peptidyl-prolyl cis-trans isomerase [Cellulomonas soli]|uniref:FKBP-type peptidyl-prolyl cis-trans isomerase n=1 Tax=Cellulomonas soli TaxID=931535 RepID=UPI003F85DD43
MRRTIAAPLAAAGVALTLLLSACGGGSGSADPTESASATASASAEETASPEDVAALEKVTLTGDPGTQPTITLPTTPFELTGTVARVVDEGTGADIEDGQVLVVHYVSVAGTDGSVVSETYTSTPTTITMGDGIVTALRDALEGQKVGVRILLGRGATDGTQVLSLEVTDARTIPDRAEGEAVAPVDGLPTVTLADDGEPSITAATGTAPTELVVQPLITGAGPAVASGQTVTVHYSGWLWDGTAFDSSWGADPISVTLGAGQVIDGWDQGLVGQTVGSQVLLVIPPSLGYGDTETGSIPAGSTLVFVVDILDAA